MMMTDMARAAYEAGATSWTDQWFLGWEEVGDHPEATRRALDRTWGEYLSGEYNKRVTEAIAEGETAFDEDDD